MSFKTKLILKSSGARIAQTLITVVIGIVMMPFLISTLGEELYGLWIVIGSVVGTYYLLDMGFSQAITRYVAKYIHQNNPLAANRVINTALVLYSGLGVIVLLISIVASQLGVETLMGASENIELAQTLLIIAGLALALEFPAKSFPGIVSAYLRYDFIALVRTIKAIADALLIYAFLSNGYGLVALATITLVTGLISTAVYVRFTSRLFKELKFSKNLIDPATLKDVFHFSKWVFIFDMNTMIRNKMDIWFIAFFQSSAVLTVYYVAVRLTEYALQFLTQATGFTGPIFTEYYAKAEEDKLRQSVVAFIKLNIAIGTIFIVGFFLIGESFIRIWMGDTFAYHQAYLCLLILAIGRFAVYFAAPLQSYLMTINRHRIGAWLSVAETLASAALLWLLVPEHGITGAALAIAIPTAIGRLLVLPCFVVRFIAIGLFSLGARICLFVGLSTIFVILSKQNVASLSTITVLSLPIVAVAIAIVQSAISLVLFDRSERSWVIQLIQRRKARPQQ